MGTAHIEKYETCSGRDIWELLISRDMTHARIDEYEPVIFHRLLSPTRSRVRGTEVPRKKVQAALNSPSPIEPSSADVLHPHRSLACPRHALSPLPYPVRCTSSGGIDRVGVCSAGGKQALPPVWALASLLVSPALWRLHWSR